jgi:hypothetical protein
MGAHHRHCRGSAFYMEEGHAIQIHVDSRVMLDAAFFRKINPNYSRPRINEPANTKGKEYIGFSFDLDTLLDSSNSSNPDEVKSNDTDLAEMKEIDFLICCPTIPGFSLSDKLWGETLLLR